jgi:cell division protein FtsW (lipid II flippase)
VAKADKKWKHVVPWFLRYGELSPQEVKRHLIITIIIIGAFTGALFFLKPDFGELAVIFLSFKFVVILALVTLYLHIRHKA